MFVDIIQKINKLYIYMNYRNIQKMLFYIIINAINKKN